MADGKLRWQIAEAIEEYGRQGLDVEASAPLINARFPEASAEDKAAAVELGGARAMLRMGLLIKCSA